MTRGSSGRKSGRSGRGWPGRLGGALLAEVLLERLQRGAGGRGGEVRRRPQVLAVGTHPVALAQPPRGDAVEGVHQAGDGDLWRGGDQQVDVVVSPSSSSRSAPTSAHT